MGSETKEADIIVYNDDDWHSTHILVECKKENLTDQQFKITFNQAFALARSNDELLAVFAKDFFKSAVGNFILDRVKRPVARANINLDEIEIANHITQIRQQAQALKDKTKLVLQKANDEIENLLLN